MYQDLKEGTDDAHLIASVKLVQTFGTEYKMPFWPIDIIHFGTTYNEEVAFRVP